MPLPVPVIDTDRLQTVFNYAQGRKNPRTGKPITQSYVYKLIKMGKLEGWVVDGMQFVVLPDPNTPS